MADVVIQEFVKQVEIDGYKSFALASGAQMVSADSVLSAPQTIKEVISFSDIRGFIEYALAFKGIQEATPVCFAGKDKITVIFDYHNKDSKRHGHHKAAYCLTPSGAWQRWEGKNNKWLSQQEFVEFIDTGLNEVTDPAQGDLLALLKDFRATVKYQVDNTVDGQGGSIISYTEEIKGGCKRMDVALPKELTIVIEPFKGLQLANSYIADESKKIPAYNLKARLWWRMEGEDRIQFKYVILGLEKAKDETLENLRTGISEATGIQTFIC